ncbi:hypothetical protein JW826_00535 [Candidatus Woesearchaeota archaeon]|nr:hypothetical protein [Candidatus Woesearchaeota archaeon]
MVFLLFLVAADVTFAILMLLTHLGVLHSWRAALGGAFFWMGKGILFRGSFLSVLDFIAGLYFILVMFGVHSSLVYVFLAIMLYKFTISLILRG